MESRTTYRIEDDARSYIRTSYVVFINILVLALGLGIGYALGVMNSLEKEEASLSSTHWTVQQERSDFRTELEKDREMLKRDVALAVDAVESELSGRFENISDPQLTTGVVIVDDIAPSGTITTATWELQE